jgi:hypothetical protein
MGIGLVRRGPFLHLEEYARKGILTHKVDVDKSRIRQSAQPVGRQGIAVAGRPPVDAFADSLLRRLVAAHLDKSLHPIRIPQVIGIAADLVDVENYSRNPQRAADLAEEGLLLLIRRTADEQAGDHKIEGVRNLERPAIADPEFELPGAVRKALPGGKNEIIKIRQVQEMEDLPEDV